MMLRKLACKLYNAIVSRVCGQVKENNEKYLISISHSWLTTYEEYGDG